MEIRGMIFLACPPVYTLPGTWNDPDKIAKCNETLIPHLTLNPNYTFGISIAVITILLAGYGVYKGFFANKGLTVLGMIMKIDTQGMSYGTGKGNGKSIEEQRAALPDVEPKKINLISDALKDELKQLINEVLDERKYIIMQEERND